MPEKLLAEERAFYEEHFEEYRRKYAGRYLLIHGSRLIGDYENEMDACYEGYRQAWRTGTEDHGYLVLKAGEPAVKTVTMVSPIVIGRMRAATGRACTPGGPVPNVEARARRLVRGQTDESGRQQDGGKAS